MSEIRIAAEKAEQKKSYSRPELVKHGAVESLTQGAVYGGSSAPCMVAID